MCAARHPSRPKLAPVVPLPHQYILHSAAKSCGVFFMDGIGGWAGFVVIVLQLNISMSCWGFSSRTEVPARQVRGHVFNSWQTTPPPPPKSVWPEGICAQTLIF